MPSLLVSLDANNSIPTFFGPATTFAQMLSGWHWVTSIVNCCQRHFPIKSFRPAAEASAQDRAKTMSAQIRIFWFTNAPFPAGGRPYPVRVNSVGGYEG